MHKHLLVYTHFGTMFYIAIVLIVVGLIAIGISADDFDEIISVIGVGLIVIALIILAVILLVSFFNSPMFRADDYKNLVTIETGNFNEDIPSSKETEVMDMTTAINMGSRVIGEIDDISKYTISDEYNMIIYQDTLYRVSPLDYASTFKAWSNSGINGYVLVNCDTKEAKLVKLDEKIYFSPSATFSYNLKRHIRKSYSNALLGKEQFEIDEEGKPYYIVPTYKNTIGLFSGRLLDKVLIVNAINGEISEYTIDTIPEWVDHVDSVGNMMDLASYSYKYVHGFFNTIFSEKDVKNLSYRYLGDNFAGYGSTKTKNGIVYTTCVTSVNNDESIVGFISLNPKTGKIIFYECTGAEESTAQSSAEGAVQNYGYKASFPQIVKEYDQETYFMTLKDKNETIIAYSYVNMKNYSIVACDYTKEGALAKYGNALNGININPGLDFNNNSSVNNIIENKTDTIENNPDSSNIITITSKITNIYSAVENSTTYFYYTLEGYNELFVSSITNNRNQLLFKVNDTINIEAISKDNYYLVKTIDKN